MTATPLTDFALSLLDAGLSIIPIETKGKNAKKPHYKALVETGHSRTVHSERLGRDVQTPTWAEFQQDPPTSEEVKAWFGRYKAKGIGMVTGEISGLVAIDFDLEGLPLLRTLGWEPHTITPSGGAHVYVKHPGWRVRTAKASGMRDPKLALPPGVDMRGDGGYIIIPPTKTSAGEYQRTQRKGTLSREEIPEEVTAQGQTYYLRSALTLDGDPALRREREQAAQGRALGFAKLPPGQEGASLIAIMKRAIDIGNKQGRNEGGFFLACQMRDNGYAQAEAESLYDTLEANFPDVDTKGKPNPYTRREYLASIKSAYSRPARPPWNPSRAG